MSLKKNVIPFINKDIILFIILVTLTLLISSLNLNIVYGLSFNFTSIFIFLILRLYGLPSALLTTMLTFLFIPLESIYISYNIILIGEMIFVGAYFHYKKKGKMIIIDSFFWLTIGLVTLFALNKTYLAGDALYFQMCKDILNSLFNVLIADMLLAYFPFYKIIKFKKINKNNVSVHQFLIHMSIVFILVPLFLSTFFKTWETHEEIIITTNQKAELISTQIRNELYLLKKTDSITDELQTTWLNKIIKHYQSDDFSIVLTDNHNKILTHSTNMTPNNEKYYNWNNMSEVKKITPTFYEVLPREQNNDFPLLKWRSGHLVYIDSNDTLPLNIYIQFPIAQYQNLIFQDFLINLKVSILFSLFTIIFVQVISHIFLKNIEQLTTVTTGLPKKLFKLEKIEWPQSIISEIRLLTTNLKAMTQKLNELFHESIEMNRILTIQTKKLKTSEQKLHQLAFYDVLTNLPNRLHFQNYVKDHISGTLKDCERLAIIFIDLNQFKQVNDTLGHDAGDTLLQLTAARLCNLIEEDRMVFRLSGDEFVVVDKVCNRKDIDLTLTKIKTEFSLPFQINGHVLYISASVGVSVFPEDGCDLDTLVKCADIAMYVCKENGSHSAQYFHESMKDKFHERLYLENSLRAVIASRGLKLYFQPKFKGKMITSLEALLRWEDANLGNVPPSTFIPLAEEIGLISKIDEWSLLEACKQIKHWQDQYHIFVPVSVNISAKNFQNDHLITIIKKALFLSGLEAKYLKLEITESVFIKNTDYVANIIRQIKSLGVMISIDDFGKGYSAFIHLLKLPIDEIKIDRQFIKDIDQDEKKKLLVMSLIELAHGLQLNIVAEGIETNCEREMLMILGCDELQGYLFSKPLSTSKMETFLQTKTLRKPVIATV
ncbi:putative bifunctional diguanylate cyclase/phosphodiesterase [Bacillus marasmi]|uniref:putative bifunctional diguanylate cyclase/phosphodiesterase n=1 Tax=Bacillus marasmi TaxID=1926279 RepID=UPI0011CA9FE9|nr:EAL domain-containing protein [Bacillus marasmi]